MNDIFESNFSLSALNCKEEISEEIFTELNQVENYQRRAIDENNSGEISSGDFSVNSIENYEEVLEQLSKEKTQITEKDCNDLDKYI